MIPKSEIKPADIGHYPEISVKALYSDFGERSQVKPYLPPKVHKGRQCDKEYFWTIVNTMFEDEVSAILNHANIQRNATDTGDLVKESISMT